VLDEYFYGFIKRIPRRSLGGQKRHRPDARRAIEDTHTFGVGSPVLALLPQFRDVLNDDSRKKRMTVGDLLTMASGLACDDNDDASPATRTMQSQPPETDWYK